MPWKSWFRRFRQWLRLNVFWFVRRKTDPVGKRVPLQPMRDMVQTSPSGGTTPPKKPKHSMETEKLLQELREAHLEWVCARKRLDHVLEEEEIDYAIFALETAEKRYSMLLKQAKAWNITGDGLFDAPVHKPARKFGGEYTWR